MRPDVAAWLARARADAEARGLAPLLPLLDTLARSTAALRDAEFTKAGPAEPADAGADDPAQSSDASHTAR
jgi:hypothetical protein